MEQKEGKDVCSSCGYEFEADERFCPVCGMRREMENAIEEEMYCKPEATLYGPPEIFLREEEWE